MRKLRVGSIGALFGSNMLSMMLSLVGSLVTFRYVTPEELGGIRSYGLITGYLLILHLGTFDAMKRRYAYFVGSGQRRRGEFFAVSAFNWIVPVTVVAVTPYFVLALYNLVLKGDPRAAAGLAMQIPLLGNMLLGGFLSAYLSAQGRFVEIAKISMRNALVIFCSLPLMLINGYYGFVLRNSLGQTDRLWSLSRRISARPRVKFSLRRSFGVIKVGFPLFVSGYLETALWASLEATFVFAAGGTTALGYYSLILTAREAASALPNAIGDVYTQRVNALFGKTRDVAACLRALAKPCLGLFAAMTGAYWVGNLLAAPLLQVLAPKYLGGVEALGISLMHLPVQALTMPNTVAQLTLQKRYYLVPVLVGLAVFVGLAWLWQEGGGLEGVLLAGILGRLTRALTVRINVELLIRSQRKKLA